VKALSCFWNELPVIASGVKSELQHSEGTGIPRFTIRLRCSENAMRIFPSAADNKFTNAMCRVRLTFRILGSKAFIIVIVPVDHHIRSRVVQHLPQWLHLRVVAMGYTRTEKRPVKISQCTGHRMLSQVLPQPTSFRR
jgi:hypothetical protein